MQNDGAEVMTDFDNYKERMEFIRGCMVRAETIKDAAIIAWEMGMEFVGVLTCVDLIQMTEKAPDVVPNDKLESFWRADLVIESVLDGETQFAAVEVAFTGTAGDAERSIRNANFLTRLTGCPATPAVASVEKSAALDFRIESGGLHWHYVTKWDRDMG